MKLILQNGYPYPYNLSKMDAEVYDCRAFTCELEGVVHFEWKYILTVEFENESAFRLAWSCTGWERFGDGLILEANLSIEDGYDHPAIVVYDKAYCGFILIG